VWLVRPLGALAAIVVSVAVYASALWALGYTRSIDHRMVKRLLLESPQGGHR
jgi:hypothetical protein